MVSVYPRPPPGQEFTHFYSCFIGGDPLKTPGMNRTENIDILEASSCWNAGEAVEDPSRKVRKPYTITKSREIWSEQEHDKFLDALQLFDRDWKKIAAFVGSKTVIQIRSHAQKYFLKVQKNGRSEHVPPPRPKRKAGHSYPQKAPKNVVSQATGPLQSSAALLESRYAVRPDSVSVPRNPIGRAPLSPLTYNGVQTGCVSHISKDNFGSVDVTMKHKYNSSSNERIPPKWTSNETNCQVKEKQYKAMRVMPDFAQVYSFIGSVFDPSAGDHLHRLKRMDPINVETVLMLMKNLSVNLASHEFENHRRLLSSCDVGIENDIMESKIPSVSHLECQISWRKNLQAAVVSANI